MHTIIIVIFYLIHRIRYGWTAQMFFFSSFFSFLLFSACVLQWLSRLCCRCFFTKFISLLRKSENNILITIHFFFTETTPFSALWLIFTVHNINFLFPFQSTVLWTCSNKSQYQYGRLQWKQTKNCTLRERENECTRSSKYWHTRVA